MNRLCIVPLDRRMDLCKEVAVLLQSVGGGQQSSVAREHVRLFRVDGEACWEKNLGYVLVFC